MTTDNIKPMTRLWLATWLVGGVSCCWQAATGLMDPGEWLYVDLQLAMSGLALIIPGVMLLTRFRPGSPALFAVANLGGWFLGMIALVQLPTGGSRGPLTATFFACAVLYGVLGFAGMFLNRNNDSPSDDDHDTPDSERQGVGGRVNS